MLRSFLGWITLLLFLLPSAARAQVKGEVESIGFEGLYRPSCWTPMIVRLSATTSTVFDGLLTVEQNDPDGDHVTFTREIQLAGNSEGAVKEQRFWMYFIPEPAPPGGKAEPRVFVCDAAGKQLLPLPVTSAMINIDDQPGSTDARRRGSRLVLYVATNSRPTVSEYDTAAGLNEDVTLSPIPAGRIETSLPENVIGYEAVDAILWLDASPLRLLPKQRAALDQYVRGGGQLVVCQTARSGDWRELTAPDNTSSFASLLPVLVDGIGRSDNLQPLRTLHQQAFTHNLLMPPLIVLRDHPLPVDPAQWSPWPALLPRPIPLAIATAKPSAIVDLQAPPPGHAYLARWRCGLGSVTWVAQDLADAQYIPDDADRARWMYVWDRIFDWPNNSIPDDIGAAMKPEAHDKFYPSAPMIKLDYAFLRGMDLPSTGEARVGLTILFFFAYWAVAGPGAYFYLRSRRRTGYSWPVFALSALAGTFLTVLIVQGVLRGDPQVQHVSFVRVAPGQMAHVHSGLGLYVPHDGYQTIALDRAAPDTGSYVTAFPVYPEYYDSNNVFTAHEDYDIPVMDGRQVRIPYRSTLKRLQAAWTGDLPGISGRAFLRLPTTGQSRLTGQLTNDTGLDLTNVYLVFNFPGLEPRTPREDWIVYWRNWPHDYTADLEQSWGTQMSNQKDPSDVCHGTLHAFLKPTVPGRLNEGYWDHLWLARWYAGSGFTDDTRLDEPDARRPLAFPMLSLFDRLPVMAELPQEADSDVQENRCEMGRLWGRFIDASHDVSAGQLVVLAQADNAPLPIPLLINRQRITGTGTTYYQFILPLDHSALPPPTTQPVASALTNP